MNQPIPETMQAVQLDEPDGQLHLREVPVPKPEAGQVLVRMAAAPLNPSDLGILSGQSYKGKHSYPFTPGVEGSGTIAAAGDGLLPRILLGKRVVCSGLTPGNGTWAEYMVTSAQLCSPLSSKVGLEQGAMQLVNPLTALGFFELAKKEKHPAIVSTAAASALGGMILRLGKRHNIPVIHLVRRQEQVDLVRQRGGEHILNSSDADFGDQLHTIVHQLKATLFLDAIGGEMTKQLTEAAPYGSTILLYGRLADKDSILSPSTALINNLHIRGWFLANYLHEKNLIQSLLLSRKAQSFAATDLHSPIHKKFPLAAAQEALDTYVNNMSAGKNLLIMNPD
jgi:NADPH:quinone reductase